MREIQSVQDSVSVDSKDGRSWEIEIRLGQIHAPAKRLGIKASDRSIAWDFGLKPVGQAALIQDSFGACVDHQNGRPSGLGFGFSLITFPTYHLLAATTSSDDGLKISTTERTRWCFIEVE